MFTFTSILQLLISASWVYNIWCNYIYRTYYLLPFNNCISYTQIGERLIILKP